MADKPKYNFKHPDKPRGTAKRKNRSPLQKERTPAQRHGMPSKGKRSSRRDSPTKAAERAVRFDREPERLTPHEAKIVKDTRKAIPGKKLTYHEKHRRKR